MLLIIRSDIPQLFNGPVGIVARIDLLVEEFPISNASLVMVSSLIPIFSA